MIIGRAPLWAARERRSWVATPRTVRQRLWKPQAARGALVASRYRFRAATRVRGALGFNFASDGGAPLAGPANGRGRFPSGGRGTCEELGNHACEPPWLLPVEQVPRSVEVLHPGVRKQAGQHA